MIGEFTLYQLTFYFFIYAFIGWCLEVLYAGATTGKFVNRGFLNGPVCPIYGFGAIIIILLLTPLKSNLLMFFLFAVFITSFLELIIGIVLEKVFHEKWWDYSDMPYNLGGYICLKFSLIWGVASVFLIMVVQPFIATMVGLIPGIVGNIIIISAIGLIIADSVITIVSISNLRRRIKFLYNLSTKLNKEINTLGEEITSKAAAALNEKYNELIKKKNLVINRLAKAYPQFYNGKHRIVLKEILEKKRLSEKLKNEAIEQGKAEKPFAYGMGPYKLFWIFLLGCIIGVIVETIWCIITLYRVESRTGLIYGPFNPVYGFGAVIITICMSKLTGKRDIWIFLGCMLVGGAFEYICSVFQELALGTVSWEYSDTPLNIGGRTNFMYSFFWGLLGLLWVKDLYPRLSHLIEKIPKKIGVIATYILLVFMIFNIVISSAAVYRQSERKEGVPPGNFFEEFLDKQYPDSFLEKVYPNMVDR